MSGAIHVDKQRRREVKIVEVAPPIARTSAPLTVGPAFDPAEQEADRVAEEVLARLRPDPQAGARDAQRLPAAAEGSVVGAEGGPLPPAVAEVIEGMRGGGEPLPPEVRGRMEAVLGTDLGQVRVHTGPEAAALSNSLSARAFTRGSDIFFAAGEYAPDTPRGERTLAHELAHVHQQSGVRRVHRLWDLKASPLPWAKGHSMRTLKTRNVWFIKDDTNDEIVIKIENQPIGLGDIVGSMQKKVANIKSVEQRKLTASDRGPLQALVEESTTAQEPSWIARGREINQINRGTAASDDEFLQLAEDDAVKELQGTTKNVMAMTVAGGMKAEDWAAQPRGATAGDTQMRAILEAPGHCRMLGQMTAVDLLLDNEDRAYSGNLGNWFYTDQDPDLRSAMTLIDHVGPAQATFIATRDWNNRDNMKTANLHQTAAYTISQIESGMQRAGDNGVTAWLDASVTGKTRRERLTADFEVGLRLARLRIIDIFTATKFDLFKKKERATKKQIKAVAAQATTLDEGDAKYGGKAAPNYYAEIKRRAMLMKSN